MQPDVLFQLPVQTASPIIKWAGGKNSLIAQFKPHFPSKEKYNRYFEPFIGGGAVFFHLQPQQSFLFDLNSQLIDVYTAVRDHLDDLILALRIHHNDSNYFYEVRAQKPSDLTLVQRAARFIFLNHTCYNGLYRENSSGQFNVPFGKYKNPNICDEPGLRAASAALQHAQLEVADFAVIADRAKAGDLIYFDPPYEPLSPTSSFTSYTSSGFSSTDQARLATMFRVLDARGCLLMLSNSSAPLIYDLFQGFNLHEINARRAINSKPDGRGVVKELLVTNFRPDQG